MSQEIYCLCGEPLPVGANYCPRCGREMRQICPVCYSERRLLSRSFRAASTWCPVKGELLTTCVRCGRWFPSGIARCPDPGCGGAVDSLFPGSTGRASDGSGGTRNWQWPAIWDRHNPDYAPPIYGGWQSTTPVHTAFAAHGQLYMWTADALLSPGSTSQAQDGKEAWRCWLGFGSEPEPTLTPPALATLLGGAAILATAGGFVAAGLFTGKSSEALKLTAGRPIAHASSSIAWFGWALDSGNNARLYHAGVSPAWRNITASIAADVPAELAPRSGTRMLAFEDTAYWTAENGTPCSYCRTDAKLTLHGENQPGLLPAWCDARGMRTIRSGSDGIRCGLDPLIPGGLHREAAAGYGPVRDVFTAQGLTVIVGDTVVTLDTTTGYVQGGGRFNGQWIAGAMAPAENGAPDQEPRLLMLTKDGEEASLIALRASSGGEEFVWRARGQRPLSLLSAGSLLYIVLERGIISIAAAHR
jgi:hypothetical protein